MSSLTTTTINTKNGVTNLTVSTGNTSGPAIVISSATDVSIRANTSANVLIANSSGLTFPLGITGAVTIANTLATGNTTITGILATGNTTITGILATGNTTITGTGSVSTNTFNLGSSSLTSNGYTYLFNGIIMQWGSVLSNTISGAVTLPITFPTAILQSVCTANNRADAEVSVEAQSTSTLTIRCESTANPATVLVRYMAIGY